MDSPTSQSVASYLSNHMGFQNWLAQHANQNVASLHNDPELSKFREEYNQNLNLGKLRTDPAQNTNIDINTFMQGVEMASQMNKQVTAQKEFFDVGVFDALENVTGLGKFYQISEAFLKANPTKTSYDTLFPILEQEVKKEFDSLQNYVRSHAQGRNQQFQGWTEDDLLEGVNQLTSKTLDYLKQNYNRIVKQAQQTSNLEQLMANVNRSLITAQNNLVDLVDLLNQGFMGGGGQAVETNVPSSEEQEPSGQLERLKQVADQILPQIEQAAQIFQSEVKYFSSFSGVQNAPVISKKVSIATKYTTGIKSLQDAHDQMDKVYQFADNFPYFVLNYEGFKTLCNFKTACNNVKKDIENLQKI